MQTQNQTLADADFLADPTGFVDLYARLKAAGVQIDSHQSDLYFEATPASRAILAGYKFRKNVTAFRSEIDGTPWFDAPCAYEPFWPESIRRS